MDKFLLSLGVGGLVGLATGSYKMFSVDWPEELKNAKYPLKAREAILKSLHAHSLNDKLTHLQQAKDICAKRYGQISPQFTNLLCTQTSLIIQMGDCDAKVGILNTLLQKPHVGEAIDEELKRWNSIVKVLSSLNNQECQQKHLQSVAKVEEAKERLGEFVRNQLAWNKL